ncbi:hypothetical protein GWI33_005325 [Rhynchophorus ferrugineus]|uniref:Uncharacterized protein n=1 Tax=Rhynchophorus ferrugineus TaxID=354439 RepID=A0A834IYE5_RHYFE|nr:hypothetical protein GWI33_005325 [Rhynchophorus ferrugineus]
MQTALPLPPYPGPVTAKRKLISSLTSSYSKMTYVSRPTGFELAVKSSGKASIHGDIPTAAPSNGVKNLSPYLLPK